MRGLLSDDSDLHDLESGYSPAFHMQNAHNLQSKPTSNSSSGAPSFSSPWRGGSNDSSSSGSSSSTSSSTSSNSNSIDDLDGDSHIMACFSHASSLDAFILGATCPGGDIRYN
jgi:hypothetical protein